MREGQKTNVVPVNLQKKTKINYFTTSRTINSDYKKIKKKVFIVAAEAIAIFFVSVGHTVENIHRCSHNRRNFGPSKDDICILKLG